jgi:TM2 domain-containing membrane protein YozV
MTDRVLWSPGVAAVLSLVIPGAGQMYKGQVLNGLVWLVVVVIGYVMFIAPGVILHIFCILGAASGKNTAPDPAAPNPDTHVKCPDCRELVLRDARKCKHCGSALQPLPPTVSTSSNSLHSREW